MQKIEKILRFTSNKTRRISLTLNEELIVALKNAAKKQNTKITSLIEVWIINYLDKNKLLDD